MTQVNMDNVVYCSLFPGLGNYTSKTVSFTIPAQSLDGSAFPSDYYESTNSVFMDNDNAISQIQVNISGINSGLSSVWHSLRGYKTMMFSGTSRSYDLFSSEYELTIEVYYEAGALNIHTTILTTTLAVVNIPAITITVEAQLFLAPFS